MATTVALGNVSFVSTTRPMERAGTDEHDSTDRMSGANPNYQRPRERAGTDEHDSTDGMSGANPNYPRPRERAGTEDLASTDRMSGANPSYPRPLTEQLEEVVESWAKSQYELVTLAADFADSPEWILTGSPTAAHWLAIIADVEPCTAREWIRIGRILQALPVTADAFKNREISYSKARTLTRLATPDNERELLAIATTTTAADLGRALAAWLHRNANTEDIDAHHQRQRSANWRTEPDGMVSFTLRLPPLLAAMLITFLTTWIMRSKPSADSSGNWPTVAQQGADAIEALLTDGAGNMDTEVVLHVSGDGNTLDDGTPISDSVVAKLIPESFIRALIHDSNNNPIDATNRRRHPNKRQKCLVKARDQRCVACGRADLLEYDHVPAHEETGHTITTELRLRCAPCHHQRHGA